MNNPPQYTGKTAYSNKAELYAKYRWDYAPRAIEAIFSAAGLTAQSTVADIGAGTGILTRHFLGRVGVIYAVEPNAQMREFLGRGMGDRPRTAVLEGSAEQTGIPAGAVDLITVAQAIHWFDPQPTLAEFRRIASPRSGGWLAVLYNTSQPDALGAAVEALCTPENGVNPSANAGITHKAPVEFYFTGEPERRDFPFAFRQNFEGFFGALCSVSYMPGPEHPRFETLRREAQALYDRYCPQGWHEVLGETHLIIGRLA